MIAMILAAGRGERMRPLTDHTPKPLLIVGGKPLIVWHIERLAQSGIKDLVINHAHLGAQIESALGDGSRYGVNIRYSPEYPTALETAGGIANALPLLGEQPFAVINGDIWCDYDFSHLPTHAATLQSSNDTAHLVLINNPPHHPNGDFTLNDGRLLPPPADEGAQEAEGLSSKTTFSGIGIYRPELFAHIAPSSKAALAPLLHRQIALNNVSAEYHSGRWVDVGTPQRLQDLDNALSTLQNVGHD